MPKIGEIVEKYELKTFFKKPPNKKFRNFLCYTKNIYFLKGECDLKTFKMLSFALIKEDSKQNFPLIDGIVINQENSHKSWVLELFISKEHIATFQQLHKSGEVVDVHVVISFPDNEPAPFSVVVSDIREIRGNYSVLLKGAVTQLRKKYAEHLLKLLLEEDLPKEELIDRFEKGMKERPKLREI